MTLFPFIFAFPTPLHAPLYYITELLVLKNPKKLCLFLRTFFVKYASILAGRVACRSLRSASQVCLIRSISAHGSALALAAGAAQYRGAGAAAAEYRGAGGLFVCG